MPLTVWTNVKKHAVFGSSTYLRWTVTNVLLIKDSADKDRWKRDWCLWVCSVPYKWAKTILGKKLKVFSPLEMLKFLTELQEIKPLFILISNCLSRHLTHHHQFMYTSSLFKGFYWHYQFQWVNRFCCWAQGHRAIPRLQQWTPHSAGCWTTDWNLMEMSIQPLSNFLFNQIKRDRIFF